MEIGGGVDFKPTRGIAIRPAEFNYLPTRFSPLNFALRSGVRYWIGALRHYVQMNW
jgi:hypothetical protein